MPERQRLGVGGALREEPRLQAGQQKVQELLVAPGPEPPALLAALGRDRGQLAERQLQGAEVAVWVRAEPRPGTTGAEVQERLDDPLVGDDQEDLMVGVDEVAEADTVQQRRDLLGV